MPEKDNDHQITVEDRTRRKLQLCQLNIARDIDRICRENGLKYFMVGGTLLGAVRHGGFIPWDDDLDIAMFRSDYEALQEIIIREHSERYFLQNSQTDPHYSRVIAKVRLRGTIQMERSYEKTGGNAGIYVDIFPIDRITKTDGLGIRLRGMVVRLCFAYKTLQAGSDNRHHSRLKKALSFVPKLIPPKWIDRLMDAVCAMENDKHGLFTTMFLSGYGWKRQTRPAAVYGEGIDLPFENAVLMAPQDPDAFLKKLFGEYMQLPPEEKRVAHKLVKIDFGMYDEELENQLGREFELTTEERPSDCAR